MADHTESQQTDDSAHDLVISSTATQKHPQLQDLNLKIHETLVSFDTIPQDYQMDALDIIQGMVNQVMQKITMGRIMAVKFVPIEKDESQEASIDVKQEPIELDSASPSPISLPGLCDDEDEPTNRDEPLNTSRPIGTIEVQPQPLTSSQEVAPVPEPVFMVKHEPMDELDEPPVMQSSPKKRGRKRKVPDASTPSKSKKKNKKSPLSVPETSTSNTSSDSLKTPGSRKKVRRRKISNDKTPAAQIVGPAKSLQKSPDDVFSATIKSSPGSDKSPTELNSVLSRLNGPLILSPVKDFKTTEEIRSMFPEEVFTPKKSGPAKKNVSILKRYKCTQCPYSTDKKDHMEIHMVAHTKEKNFHCELCDKDFTAAASLKRHMQIHKGEKDYECPVCLKKFYTLGCLRQHAPKHTGEKNYHCSLCDKSYTLQCNLRRHMRVHTGEMPYRCDICEGDVTFRDYSSLKFHKLKHSGEKPYACDVCDKRFRTSSDIIRHKRIHSDKKEFTCDECGRAFTQRATLIAHKRVHTDIKPWKCELCSKAFRTKSSQQHHMRWHAGIKPYQCDVCHKNFTTKTYLANHQVVHTKDMPWPCRFCHIKFNQRSNRDRHERIHSNKRRYKCRYCDKAFKYGNALAYHEGIHTGVKEVCDKCGMSFRTKISLKKHILTCDSSGKVHRAPRRLIKEFNAMEDRKPILKTATKPGKKSSLLSNAKKSKSSKALFKAPKSPLKIRLAIPKPVAKKTPIKEVASPEKRPRGRPRKVVTTGVNAKQPQVCLEKISVDAVQVAKGKTVPKTPKRRGRPPKAKGKKTVTDDGIQLQVDDIKEEPLDLNLSGENVQEVQLDLDLGVASHIEDGNCQTMLVKQEKFNDMNDFNDLVDTSRELDVVDTSKEVDVDISKEVDVDMQVDTSKEVDVVDTSKEVDVVDTSKEVEVDTSKEVEVDISKEVDTSKEVDVLDTSKEVKVDMQVDTSKEVDVNGKDANEENGVEEVEYRVTVNNQLADDQNDSSQDTAATFDSADMNASVTCNENGIEGEERSGVSLKKEALKDAGVSEDNVRESNDVVECNGNIK